MPKRKPRFVSCPCGQKYIYPDDPLFPAYVAYHRAAAKITKKIKALKKLTPDERKLFTRGRK